jgi:Fe-S-cluster-containing dehydrogenase component
MKHFGVDDPEHARIRIEEFPDGNLYVPVVCQACGDSLCIKVCPMNARVKLESGAVVTDEERCIGCRTCVYVCPIGAPVENPVSGKLMTCDRCQTAEDGPLCAVACADKRALIFIESKSLRKTTVRKCAARMKTAFKPAKDSSQ